MVLGPTPSGTFLLVWLSCVIRAATPSGLSPAYMSLGPTIGRSEGGNPLSVKKRARRKTETYQPWAENANVANGAKHPFSRQQAGNAMCT
jgi:hypothetical protein